MRISSVNDCLQIFAHYQIDPSGGEAIDIGGTEMVILGRGGKIDRNPLLNVNPGLKFLDQGFNVNRIGARADFVLDFLDPEVVQRFHESFDIAFCFDTLEHVSNPFEFCRHLLEIVKPGGYVYIATVFQWPYHPSPEDYFRFTPAGLCECFSQGIRKSSNQATILWCDWESDSHGVALLAYKGDRRISPRSPLVLKRENLPSEKCNRVMFPRTLKWAKRWLRRIR